MGEERSTLLALGRGLVEGFMRLGNERYEMDVSCKECRCVYIILGWWCGEHNEVSEN